MGKLTGFASIKGIPGTVNDKTRNGSLVKITGIVIFAEVFLLASALPVLLRFFSLPSVMKYLTPEKSEENPLQWKINLIVNAVNKILGIGFFIFHPTCLKKSLILYHFLRKAGMNVVIHFGVKKNGCALDGHSWITKNGERLYDNLETVDDFSITYSYPQE